MLDTLVFWWSCVLPFSKIELAAVWFISAACLVAMKKIQPDTFWLYFGYVLLILCGLTAFAIWWSVQVAEG